MAKARIYQPARNAMQSGMAKAKHWCLKFEPIQGKNVEPLMGYTSSTDTRQQLDLTFETKEDAIAYAKRHGIDYQVSEPKKRKRIVKAYSDNFAINRIDGNWTH
ncbi:MULTISPECIES: ETC complex I subunit [Cohaesibacter]|uniref:ETC complex I subunit n=1 Tax=Cohaesibacter TaxID=655352 RepID=UPI000DEB007D|nr:MULTISPECIES: ETC complex I subunit [Cohaesibacter]TLP49239.1 ETC complex I subunit [Cohaesibacter sp. CAU 1516]